MLPYESQWWCWSIGKKYTDEDVWTCDKKLDEVVKDYQYLAIYRADNQFWENNQIFFDPASIGKTSGVYRILLNEIKYILLFEIN